MGSGDPQNIFEMTGVEIRYGFRAAVEDLTLSLAAGSSLGLLGLNGAGKTSTIRALLGMLRPRRGTITLFGNGRRRPSLFQQLGFAPEDGIPPEYLSSEEYLGFVSAFKIRDAKKRREEVKSLLDWFELTPEKKIKDFSKGMKRRLVLAQAFLGQPKLLILDEPLNGLDPLLIIKLRDKINAYREGGGSVLYSSHLLGEVEKTCTQIAILHLGKLVCYSAVESLVKDFGSVETAFAKKVTGN